MTIRDYIKKKRRRSAALMYVGFALFGLGGVITAQTQSPMFLTITFFGFALCGGSMLYQVYAIRCPDCHGRIGITLGHGSPFSLPAGYSFCPFCGKSLDSDIDAAT